jgi:putative hydrolase of the HAD superfamily
MRIQAVLFDLDDTLLWDDRSVKETFVYVCRHAQRSVGVDPAELEEAVRREARTLYASFETYPFTQDIGINPFEALWADFRDPDHPMFAKLRELAPRYRRESWTRGLAALGVHDPQLGRELGELFHEERRKRSYVYEETYSILDALKGRYKLLLLTNGSPDLQQEKLNGVPQLIPYFDHIVISGSFGRGKPAPEIFEHCMKLLGIRASEGIMVGDKLTTDIKGANTVGMASVWINRRGVPHDQEIKPAYEIRNLMEIPDVIRTIERSV